MAILRLGDNSTTGGKGSNESKDEVPRKRTSLFRSNKSQPKPTPPIPNKLRTGGCGNQSHDEPPILSISVRSDLQDGVNLPFKKMDEKERSREFAVAAEEAVRDQLECRSRSSPQQRKIPDYMQPNEKLNTFKTAILQEILFNKDLPYPGEHFDATDLSAQRSGQYGFIMFVIRRPGCKLCREQALYLRYLFENHPDLVEGFNLIGTVKEFCGDLESMNEFHENYFPFPLYQDEKMTMYHALGSRRVSLSATLQLFNPFSDVSKRLRKSNISGNFVGEGFIQGGVIIFDKDGEPAFKYEEETGLELPIDDIVSALEAVRAAVISEGKLSDSNKTECSSDTC